MPSQVCFRGNYINIRDNELVLLLSMLLDSIKESDSDCWAREVRDKWRTMLLGAGFGLYELYLDELVTNHAEKERMLEVFARAKTAMEAHGQLFKREWLNNLPNREAIYFKDQEVRRFVAKLAEIQQLLLAPAQASQDVEK